MMDTSFKYKYQFAVAKIALSICICLVLMRSSIGQEQTARVTKFDDDLVVSAEGTGASAKEALDNALIQSVQIAVGVLVVSERTVREDSLSEKTITYANAFVRDYRLNRSHLDPSGIYRTQITASVSSKKILENIYKIGQDKVPANSSALYAQALTQRERLWGGDKILRYVLSQYPVSAFSIRSEPIQLGGPQRDGSVLLNIPITISLDWNYYSNLIKISEITASDHYPELSGMVGRNDLFFFSKEKMFWKSPFEAYSFDKERSRVIIETLNKKVYAIASFKSHTDYVTANVCFDVSELVSPFVKSIFYGSRADGSASYYKGLSEVPSKFPTTLIPRVRNIDAIKEIAGVEIRLSDSCN